VGERRAGDRGRDRDQLLELAIEQLGRARQQDGDRVALGMGVDALQLLEERPGGPDHQLVEARVERLLEVGCGQAREAPPVDPHDRPGARQQAQAVEVLQRPHARLEL
jgi:hypothetical protein